MPSFQAHTQFIFEIYFEGEVIKAAKIKDGKMTQGLSFLTIAYIRAALVVPDPGRLASGHG